MLDTEKLNSRLLFIISFSLTALVIYLSKFTSLAAPDVHHNFIQSILFINITFLGSGIFCFCFILYLFYKKKNVLARLIAGSSFITLLIVQVIKIYLHKNGPQLFFEDEQYLFDPVSQKNTTGFISAHTAIAFNLAVILSLYFKNKLWPVLLFTAAFAVAYSRIYLGHHTVPDIFAGVFTGLACGALSFYFYLNHLKLNKVRFLLSPKFNNPELQ